MSPEKPQAFVLMPFTEELTALYKTAIQPELEVLGYEVHRADDLATNKASFAISSRASRLRRWWSLT
jgi:hypothetical protein